MLLPDIRFLLDDPDLGGGVSFSVTRRVYAREYGHVRLAAKQEFSATGNIQPAGTDELQSMPDEDRRNETIVLRTTFDFQTGQDAGDTFVAADEVAVWGRIWRVTRIEPWNPWGFNVAYAVLKREGDDQNVMDQDG